MLLSSSELTHTLEIVKNRDDQIKLLDSYLSPDPSVNPYALVIHGASSTGKSYTLKNLLDQSSVNYSWVSCDRCITPRIMFQKIMRCVLQDSGVVPEKALNAADISIENFTAFYSSLKKFVETYDYRKVHVLVLDRMDQSLEYSQGLFSCFAKLGELSQLDNFVSIFVINTLEPKPLIAHALPHIWFPRYTKDEAVNVMSTLVDNDVPLWRSFCSLVYDALGSYTGTDIRQLKEAAFRIWPKFVAPVYRGECKVNEVVKLYRLSEPYFSSEFAVETNLIESAEDNVADIEFSLQPSSSIDGFPLQSKYILCAAYLASYNPPTYDLKFFSKAKEARGKRRDTSRRKQLKISPRFLAAPSFEMERMLAILHSIAPHNEGFTSTIDIGVQIATLTALKLIVRTTRDPLDSRTKWKINADWSLVEKFAKQIQLPMAEYIME